MIATAIESDLPAPPPASPVRLSLRANFAWTLAGNLIYAGCQWGILIVLAKLGDAAMVGEFALALALTAPVFLFAWLNTRGLQASDARREFSFGDYLRLRLLTVTLAWVVVGMIAFGGDYPAATRAIILAVALSKSVESIADVFYGHLQQHERMDVISISMILKGVLSLGVLAAAVALGQGLLVAVLGLALVWALILGCFDVPRALRFFHDDQAPGRVFEPRGSNAMDHDPLSATPEVRKASPRGLEMWAKVARLAWLALPLGIVMGLVSLNANLPRLFLERAVGLHDLGIFAAISYLMIAGSTVINAMGQAATPRLAHHLHAGDQAGFLRLLSRALLLAAGIGACLIAIAWLGGGLILTWLYGPEYAEHTALFVWLMIAAAIGFVGSLLGYGLTAARYLHVQTLLFAVVTSVTALGCWYWVPDHGMLGAAFAVGIASVVQLIGSAAILGFGLTRGRAA